MRRGTILLVWLLLAACGRVEAPLDPLSAVLTKLDADGEVIPARAGPWTCVRDARTGLVWENKSDDESNRHGGWTYSFRDPAWARGPQGSCAHKALGSCDTATLIADANAARLCGYDDWRLPSVAEIRSLLDPRIPPPGPLVIGCYFPFTRTGSYWTSTPGTPAGRQRGVAYVGVNFGDGSERALFFNRSLFVRLVRGDADRHDLAAATAPPGGTAPCTPRPGRPVAPSRPAQ